MNIWNEALVILSDEMKQKTHEAMINPQKGDRFQEFYTHWVFVVKVTKKYVWVLSASAPCTFPEDGRLEQFTRENFIKKYSYKGYSDQPKYWIDLVDRNNNVRGWLKHGISKNT